MIRMSKEYSIHCDNCFEPLIHPDDHPLTSYVGHILTEGNTKDITEVAESYLWETKDNKHLCPKCKNSAEKE